MVEEFLDAFATGTIGKVINHSWKKYTGIPWNQESKNLVFSARSARLYPGKYSYDKVIYEATHVKVCLVCLTCGEEFMVNPSNHLTRNCGCQYCQNKTIKLTLKTFTNRANIKHASKYTYYHLLDSDIKNTSTKISIMCPTHGMFEQTPANHLNGQGCKLCGYATNSKSKSMTQSEFEAKVGKVHGDNYDVSKALYVNAKTKVTVKCRACSFEFDITPDKFIGKAAQGCRKCHSHKVRNLEDFIQEASNVHPGKYDYSKFDYVTSVTKGGILCPRHGVFYQTPNKHLQGQGCPTCADKGVGHVYLMYNEDHDLYKIGLTNNTKRRMSDLKSSWESVWSLVALSKQLNNARDFETYLHTQYKSSQAKSLDFAIFDGYTEIFKLTKNQVEQVKQELKNV